MGAADRAWISDSLVLQSRASPPAFLKCLRCRGGAPLERRCVNNSPYITSWFISRSKSSCSIADTVG